MEKCFNERIYGRRYGHGKVMICKNFPKCDTYVGCHKSGKPLGTPANTILRKLRNQCHEKFDKTWRGKRRSRNEAYKILSEMMNLPIEKTHIAMFDEDKCKKLLTLNFT